MKGKSEEKRDLLVEIGVEELPHSFIPGAMERFASVFTGLLGESRVAFGGVSEFSTPRRMALLVKDLAVSQESHVAEKRGPSVERAYLPSGEPSPALLGFLRSNGAKPDQLVERAAGNGRYLFLELEVAGLDTETLLPGLLGKTLGSLAFPKTMKWEPSGFAFARPIRWIVLLFGGRVVPFETAGVSSSRFTFGHRARSRGRIELGFPSEYEEKLLAEDVVAGRTGRMERIVERVAAVAGEEGLVVPPVAQPLFARNTDLTEFPHPILCSFDPRFLELPPEVLMSEMMEHQHYFPLVDRGTGKLSHMFVAVSNISDNTRTRSGYERVLLARLNDGKFFYTEDRKRNLKEYGEKLGSITFHEKLGTMDAKVERVGEISAALSGLLGLDGETSGRVAAVASLCKNDLVTLMVGEFPELQGVMGYYYALSSGCDGRVASGVKEHYLPRFAGDELPKGVEGAVVGIADRLDTIMGIFSIGLKPTGSKDPFGLRRRVLGIIRVVIALRLGFSMRALIEKSSALYAGPGAAGPGAAGREAAGRELVEEVSSFFKNRIRSIFEEMGFAYDEIDASLANALEDICEAYRRVEALHEMRGNEDFERLLVSFKRMGNIIKDEREFHFSEGHLREREEKELYAHFRKAEPEVRASIDRRDYHGVYRILSGFKPFVDDFFDKVLVMEEDQTLRRNRMGLLKKAMDQFADVIDFSKIVQAGDKG